MSRAPQEIQKNWSATTLSLHVASCRFAGIVARTAVHCGRTVLWPHFLRFCVVTAYIFCESSQPTSKKRRQKTLVSVSLCCFIIFAEEQHEGGVPANVACRLEKLVSFFAGFFWENEWKWCKKPDESIGLTKLIKIIRRTCRIHWCHWYQLDTWCILMC